MTVEDEALQELRNLAALIPCLMCRIKGGSNIDADGGCRHRSGMPIAEVVERYQYAVMQADNARDLASAIRHSPCIVGNVAASNTWNSELTDALDSFDRVEKT